MAMITSLKPSQDLWQADIEIGDIKVAGLPVPSIIRFKIFTLDHRLILGRLGALSKLDKQLVQQGLHQILQI